MQLISFARGAPSLDIIDVDGLKAAAVRADHAPAHFLVVLCIEGLRG